tara:strand:- start:189 stop:320 length:132 start_codon:yes stop_codon:yes gene_type:complete
MKNYAEAHIMLNIPKLIKLKTEKDKKTKAIRKLDKPEPGTTAG